MNKAENEMTKELQIDRRNFLRASIAASTVAVTGSAMAQNTKASGTFPGRRLSQIAHDELEFELEEATISRLSDAMKSGELTARSIAEKYLARIEKVDKAG
ncbi:MAG: hypothetical protein ACRD63_02190, partial [Pyrinomonadaceae bacterium]